MKHLAVIFILFLLDQISKNFIINLIPLNETFFVNSFLNIVFIYNKGFLFGYLSDLPDKILFYTHFLLFFFSTYIIYKFLFLQIEYRKISLLFFAGTLGNSFDRLFRNGVVDFIDFHYYGIHWPAFNLADSFIFIGVIIYLIKYIWSENCLQE